MVCIVCIVQICPLAWQLTIWSSLSYMAINILLHCPVGRIFVKLQIIYLCASITHWLGSISKLPNQCENITKFSRHFQNCPINVRKLPNQCEMLAHPPCASISHWLGSFQKILGSFQVYQIYQNYPINVKCLHRGGAQAFHID